MVSVIVGLSLGHFLTGKKLIMKLLFFSRIVDPGLTLAAEYFSRLNDNFYPCENKWLGMKIVNHFLFWSAHQCIIGMQIKCQQTSRMQLTFTYCFECWQHFCLFVYCLLA